jgi:ribosome-associated protein
MPVYQIKEIRMTPNEIKEAITSILEEKKANDVKVLYIADQSSIADYFVIATGKSTTQVKALCEGLEEKMEEREMFVTRKDGEKEARWIVLDYGSVIVHIFNDSMRDVYALEQLWSK